MTTPHVQYFVLISMLRGQPKTPPSGDDLAVLDYHLKADRHAVWDQFNTEGPKGLPFVPLTVTQKKGARSRFVGSEHRSCVIFCFDIHS